MMNSNQAELTQNPTNRLDQRLMKAGGELVQRLLEEFPDLRAAALVFDYQLKDVSSLPPGIWAPRRPLQPAEALIMCQRIDRMAQIIREQHDSAVVAGVRETNSQVDALNKRVEKLTSELEEAQNAKPA